VAGDKLGVSGCGEPGQYAGSEPTRMGRGSTARRCRFYGCNRCNGGHWTAGSSGRSRSRRSCGPQRFGWSARSCWSEGRYRCQWFCRCDWCCWGDGCHRRCWSCWCDWSCRCSWSCWGEGRYRRQRFCRCDGCCRPKRTCWSGRRGWCRRSTGSSGGRWSNGRKGRYRCNRCDWTPRLDWCTWRSRPGRSQGRHRYGGCKGGYRSYRCNRCDWTGGRHGSYRRDGRYGIARASGASRSDVSRPLYCYGHVRCG
jgi:hypothetical protein